MLNLDQIKQRVEQLADQIHAPADVMPTYGFLRRDGTLILRSIAWLTIMSILIMLQKSLIVRHPT
jgi:hypothetical protein